MSNESSVACKVSKRLARSAGEFCLVLLVPFMGIQLAMSAGGPVPGVQPAEGLGGAMVAQWWDDLIEDLEDATDELDDAEAAVGMDGLLSEANRAVVTEALDHVLFTIDRILDPRQYPNMDPPDAGYVDVDSHVTSLQDYALECLILAEDALHEAVSPRVDAEAIGTRLRTIEYLITRAGPHNYRTRAGIVLSDQ